MIEKSLIKHFIEQSNFSEKFSLGIGIALDQIWVPMYAMGLAFKGPQLGRCFQDSLEQCNRGSSNKRILNDYPQISQMPGTGSLQSPHFASPQC